MSHQWSHGLCGCFDNCGVCIVTYLLPCYTAGKNAEAVGDSCVVYGLLGLVPIANIVFASLTRQKVREQKSIDGSLGLDVVTTWFCYFCSLAQVAQEVNAVPDEEQRILRQ